MSVTIKPGDWIVAEKDGVCIEGQAMSNVSLGGSALVKLALGHDATVIINSNFYEITITHRNMVDVADPEAYVYLTPEGIKEEYKMHRC